MGSQIPNPDIYGTGAAARYIGVSADTMRSYADKGLIPSRRDANNDRIFKFVDLMNFVEERRREAEAPGRKAVAKIMADAYKKRSENPSYRREAAERGERRAEEQRKSDEIARKRKKAKKEQANAKPYRIK